MALETRWIATEIEAIEKIQGQMGYINATRYLSAAGLVALLYDHALTFPAEISLIWKAPPSIPKYLFLLNRYIVPMVLIVIAYQMTVFDPDTALSHDSCRLIISCSAMISIVSIGIANVLVLWRVILLWEKDKAVTRILVGGFLLSFCTTCVMMILTLIKLWPYAQYSNLAAMCILTKTSATLVVVWAGPLCFEVLVLLFTFWNALSRPRKAQQPLARALHRDGITFFLATATMRIINTGLAATARVELAMLAVFFVWAMVTLILNRSVLRMQHAEVMNARSALRNQHSLRVRNPALRATSPFGVRPSSISLPDDFNRDSPYSRELTAIGMTRVV